MPQYLKKSDGQYFLTVDEAMLAAINATFSTPFEVTIEGRSIVFTPVVDPERNEKLKASLHHINKRFGNELRELSDDDYHS